MTNTPSPSPAEIAAKLTKAQRAVLLAMSDGEWVYPASYVAADAGIPVVETVKIIREFRADGLATHGTLFNEDEGRVSGSGTWLTGPGLEVRAILQQEQSR